MFFFTLHHLVQINMKPSSKPIFIFLLNQTLTLTLTLILIFISQNSLVQAVDKFFETCRVPKTCGYLTVSFPFYIQHVQEPFCGHPGFQISCVDGGSQPILNLSGQDYLIHNIFYENESIIVSNAALTTYYSDQNLRRTCHFPRVQNLSLYSDDRFEPDRTGSSVFLLYGCNQSFHYSPPGELIRRIGCNTEYGDTNSTVLAVPGGGSGRAGQASNVSAEYCEGPAGAMTEVPVANYDNSSDLGEVLKRGFRLKWVAPDCTLCNSTGGKCGFDLGTRHFKCLCSDRPHAARCALCVCGNGACERE